MPEISRGCQNRTGCGNWGTALAYSPGGPARCVAGLEDVCGPPLRRIAQERCLRKRDCRKTCTAIRKVVSELQIGLHSLTAAPPRALLEQLATSSDRVQLPPTPEHGSGFLVERWERALDRLSLHPAQTVVLLSARYTLAPSSMPGCLRIPRERRTPCKLPV